MLTALKDVPRRVNFTAPVELCLEEDSGTTHEIRQGEGGGGVNRETMERCGDQGKQIFNRASSLHILFLQQ